MVCYSPLTTPHNGSQSAEALRNEMKSYFVNMVTKCLTVGRAIYLFQPLPQQLTLDPSLAYIDLPTLARLLIAYCG